MQSSAFPRRRAPPEPRILAHQPGIWPSVQLVEYRPSGTSNPLPIGVAWRDGDRTQWVSPLNRRFNGIFDPLPFLLRFAGSQAHWAHFALALEWFDVACLEAATTQQVGAACEREPGWYLRCRPYDGPPQWKEVSERLSGAPDWRAIPLHRVRVAVQEAAALLVREHAQLRAMQFEPVEGRAHVVGWIHAEPSRRTRISVWPGVGLPDAASLAFESDAELRAAGHRRDRALCVLPELRASGPIYLMRRVSAVGLGFGALARGLIESTHA